MLKAAYNLCNKRFATTEKSPIFQSHKSYKNTLGKIKKWEGHFY